MKNIDERLRKLENARGDYCGVSWIEKDDGNGWKGWCDIFGGKKPVERIHFHGKSIDDVSEQIERTFDKRRIEKRLPTIVDDI